MYELLFPRIVNDMIKSDAKHSNWKGWAKYIVILIQCTIFCFLFSYDNVLEPIDHITCSFDLRNEKRHLFEIPNPHCNLDLDEYEYEDDFEWQPPLHNTSKATIC